MDHEEDRLDLVRFMLGTKIGCTATQFGLSPNQGRLVKELFLLHKPSEVHIGDCIGGDHDIYLICRELGIRTVCHPPENPSKRAFDEYDEVRPELPYLDRNHNIVDETDFLIACPKKNEEELRSGTWATVRYARKKGKTVYVLSRNE